VDAFAELLGTARPARGQRGEQLEQRRRCRVP
jgi:hypothetical protein